CSYTTYTASLPLSDYLPDGSAVLIDTGCSMRIKGSFIGTTKEEGYSGVAEVIFGLLSFDGISSVSSAALLVMTLDTGFGDDTGGRGLVVAGQEVLVPHGSRGAGHLLGAVRGALDEHVAVAGMWVVLPLGTVDVAVSGLGGFLRS
ncbi:hypothetical protein QHH03_29885, partial [Aphanizomenon sp. 202]|nr:hypothetical protein [Aphanizomenon sp. 202]